MTEKGVVHSLAPKVRGKRCGSALLNSGVQNPEESPEAIAEVVCGGACGGKK